MKPNILFITSDQQHWNTIGAYNKEIKTPNLDRLVNAGTCFKRAYTVNPTCTPTRASFITGKYPSQHGAWTLGTKLMENEYTIGNQLTANNYRTALVGKAHFQPLRGTEKYPSLESYPIMQDLEFWKKFTGGFYGFDTIRLARNHTTEAHVGQHYAIWMEKNGLKNWRDYFCPPTGNLGKDAKRLWKIPERFHYDAWIADETNNLLQSYKEKNENFFLWASFFDPHPDYFVPEEWVSMYDPDKLTVPKIAEGELEKASPFVKLTQEKNPDTSIYKRSGNFLGGLHTHLIEPEEQKKDVAIYYSMISLMDKYIGSILDKLDELGLTENTLIIFTTDHGHFIGQHGLILKGPFMYEDMIKVPWIVSYPGHVPAGRVSDAIQSAVDIVPTVLDYCGMEKTDGIAGISQKDVWNGDLEKIRNYAICEHNHERNSIYIKTYICEKYKISVFLNMDYGEIYDLESDPDELNNLWDNPEYLNLKSSLLVKFMQGTMESEPDFMPRIWGA